MPDDSPSQNPFRLLFDEQEPFYRFFQSAPVLLAITSFSEGRYIEVNRMFLQTLGFSRHGVIGKTSADLGLWVNPADRKRLKKSLSHSARAFLPEIKVRTGDGIVRHMIFSAERIELDGHFCLLTAAQDITNRKHSENVLLHMEKLKSIERIVGSMACDYDQLLTRVLNGIAQVRPEVKSGSPGSAGLETARAALAEMAELTRKFKTFAECGPVHPMPVAPRPFVEESVRRAALGTGLSVAFLFSEELPPVVIDARQFDQLCHALVRNADEATRRGTLRVLASLAGLETDQVEFGFRVTAGRYVKLSFADNGEGIAKEDIPKIFDPYFSTRNEGKGLGLATVHSIVCRHGGCLSVTSKQGAGSIFNIYLPAASDRTEPVDGPPEIRRILVIEERRAFPEPLVSELFAQGIVCEVDADPSVSAAVEQGERDGRGYDAVLFGSRSGNEAETAELARALKRLHPEVACLAAVEYGMFDYVPDDRAGDGFDGVVRKPYNLSNLTTVFNRVFSPSPDGLE